MCVWFVRGSLDKARCFLPSVSLFSCDASLAACEGCFVFFFMENVIKADGTLSSWAVPSTGLAVTFGKFYVVLKLFLGTCCGMGSCETERLEEVG